MERLEVSCAVRRIYTSLGAKGLKAVSILASRCNVTSSGNGVLYSLLCCEWCRRDNVVVSRGVQVERNKNKISKYAPHV